MVVWIISALQFLLAVLVVSLGLLNCCCGKKQPPPTEKKKRRAKSKKKKVKRDSDMDVTQKSEKGLAVKIPPMNFAPVNTNSLVIPQLSAPIANPKSPVVTAAAPPLKPPNMEVTQIEEPRVDVDKTQFDQLTKTEEPIKSKKSVKE